MADITSLVYCDQILALLSQISAHAVGDSQQTIRNSVKEPVHVSQILVFVVLEHVVNAAVFHLDNGFHVRRDELVLEHLDYTRLGGLVQIVVGALALLSYSFVHFSYVDRGRVLAQELLALQAIELGRLLQEGLLEVLVVDVTGVYAERHKHLTGVLDGHAVRELTAPLLVHHAQKRLPQVVLDGRIANDSVSVENEAQIVDGLYVVGLHVDTVHVHENVSNHDHGRDVWFEQKLDFAQTKWKSILVYS